MVTKRKPEDANLAAIPQDRRQTSSTILRHCGPGSSRLGRPPRRSSSSPIACLSIDRAARVSPRTAALRPSSSRGNDDAERLKVSGIPGSFVPNNWTWRPPKARSCQADLFDDGAP